MGFGLRPLAQRQAEPPQFSVQIRVSGMLLQATDQQRTRLIKLLLFRRRARKFDTSGRRALRIRGSHVLCDPGERQRSVRRLAFFEFALQGA